MVSQDVTGRWARARREAENEIVESCSEISGLLIAVRWSPLRLSSPAVPLIPMTDFSRPESATTMGCCMYSVLY